MTVDRAIDIVTAVAWLDRLRHGRRRLAMASLAFLLLALSACATSPSSSAPAQFLLVRHADVADDDPDDPNLSADGLAQAQALAQALRQTPLAGIEVSEFRRTQQTAAATAASHGLVPARYFSRGEVGEIAHRLQRRYRRGQVLMVMDPEMLSPLAAALCRCRVAPIPDQDRRLYRVWPASDVPGRVSAESLPPP